MKNMMDLLKELRFVETMPDVIIDLAIALESSADDIACLKKERRLFRLAKHAINFHLGCCLPDYEYILYEDNEISRAKKEGFQMCWRMITSNSESFLLHENFEDKDKEKEQP